MNRCLTKIKNLDLEIIKLLDLVTIGKLSTTCKYIKDLIEEFWKRKFSLDFPHNDVDTLVSYCINYKRIVLLELFVKHFWLNKGGTSPIRKPNKAMSVPLCCKTRFAQTLEEWHDRMITDKRCSICKNGVKLDCNWIIDQLVVCGATHINETDYDPENIQRYCLIPLRKGDTICDLNGNNRLYYDGNKLVGTTLHHYNYNFQCLPVSMDMSWPKYPIDYFSSTNICAPFKKEYIALFKENMIFGMPPFDTKEWHYSCITVDGKTLYLLMDTEYLRGIMTKELFNSHIDWYFDSVDWVESPCGEYIYVNFEFLDYKEQHFVIDAE